jgi:Tol biopolymer transport system component
MGAATLKGQSPRILFTHVPRGSLESPHAPWNIYSIHTDGTQLRVLTTDDQSRSPSWSPDGRHIIYIHYDGFQASPVDLYVMDSDGGNAHLFRRFDGVISSAVWSPDGKALAIAHLTRARWKAESESHIEIMPDLFVLPSDGQGEPQLLAKQVVSFEWNPDGREFVLSRPMVGIPELAPARPEIPSRSAISVVDANPTSSSGQGEPVTLVAQAGGPVWSPDGRKLAFSFYLESEARGGIGVADADGSNQVQLTGLHLDGNILRILWGSDPVWSPNGRQIAFVARASVKDAAAREGESDQTQLFVTNADGSGMRQLTTDPGGTQFLKPVWSPDGSEIALTCVYHEVHQPILHDGQYPVVWIPRIFILSMTGPKAKPVQLVEDGTNPVFAPLP